MENTDEILYVAYKNLLTANVKSGFARQFMSDSDYYVLDKFPGLFLQIIEEMEERHQNDPIVQKFYELNPHQLENKELAKEVLKRIRSEHNFKALLDNFVEDNFINDVPLMKKLLANVPYSTLEHCGFHQLSLREDIRQACYELPNFSLTWFKLPAPEDDNLIKSLLEKNVISYLGLNPEQKLDKENTMLAINAFNNNEYVMKAIYPEIPDELKKDKEIALKSATLKVINQPIEAFEHKNILKELLDAVFKSSINNKGMRCNLKEIEGLNPQIFIKKENIKDFFEWMHENSDKLADQDNYVVVCKFMKEMVKQHPYIKEQVKRQSSTWMPLNITASKIAHHSFFSSYFKENIPKMVTEISYYIMATDLNKTTENKKRLKV